MQEACLKRVTSGCSRLAQSWSDLLSGADVFDGLSVILVRTATHFRCTSGTDIGIPLYTSFIPSHALCLRSYN